MKPDLYRRERRRLRADALLIERHIDRETRRRIWRMARIVGFTSLSRAVRAESIVAVWRRLFSGDPGWFDVLLPAARRRDRKAHNRRAQQQRMAAHQQRERARQDVAAALTLIPEPGL